VIGFTNGIAVLIALSQVKDLLGLKIDRWPADFFAQAHTILAHAGGFDPHALALGLACFFGLVLWARLAALPLAESQPDRRGPSTLSGARAMLRRAARAVTRVPGPIVALVTLSALAAWLRLPVETIGTRFGGIPDALPALAWPAFDWSDIQRLFVPTITIAMLGAVESLLCARVADGMTTQRRHDPNQELMAQGIANIVAPFFGGIPATGTIARTVTNLRAGATSPVAGIVHSITLLAIVLVAAPLAASVPLAVLSGVLLFVAWNMGEWHQFSRLRAFAPEHRAKLVATFLLTVMVDLTVAMEVGMALACIVFVYRMGTQFRIDRDPQAQAPSGTLVYRLAGPLFFGAVAKVEALADDLPPATDTIVLDMREVFSIDSSGLAVVENLGRGLARVGVHLVLRDLSETCRAAFVRSGIELPVVDAAPVQEPGPAHPLRE
ncbi:MAG TPA: SulP family inorganic anion transporter, partial [Caldimonas sp.]|nr:SulP family inorganic anion transporter [Caldimonas sp.]